MVNNLYIHTIPLVLALVGLLGQHVFAQDVSYVLAANLTSATNEHDYQAGSKSAVLYYTCLMKPVDDQWCDPPGPNDHINYCQGLLTDTHKEWRIMNVTACVDGFISGWKHWCTTYTKDCAFVVTNDQFPGRLINMTNYHQP
jgi:hypothetical protein